MLAYPANILTGNLFFFCYFKSFEMKTDSQILNATIQNLSELPKYLMNCFCSVLYTMKGYQLNVLLNAVPVLIHSEFL